MDIPTSLSLARIRGTAVRVHLLSVVTVGWYALLHAAGDIDGLIRLGSVIVAVGIHEYGHLIAARISAIRIERTVVFPFGAVSHIGGDPTPTEEIAYRLGGPLANLIVILVVAAFHEPLIAVNPALDGVLYELSMWNILIGAINLLPIAPFDGGAIFDAESRRRGLVAAWSGARLLTPLAVLCLIALGWELADPLPVTAAIMILVSAARRAAQEKTGALVGDLVIASIMTPVAELPVLEHGATVAGAIERVLRSTDTVFLVTHLDTPLGFAFRNDLVDAVIAGEQRYVAEIIDRELTMVEVSTPLGAILGRIGVETTDPLVVAENGKICGLVFREQVVEFMLVRNAAQSNNTPPLSDSSC